MKKDDFITEVEKAITKLEAQGEACKDNKGLCAYQNNKGQHCIIGFMMPDSYTRRQADSHQCPITDLAKLESFTWSDQFNHDQINLMFALQKLHDDWESEFSKSLLLMREELERYKNEGQEL
jgi:hypothetical protein